MSGVVRYGDGRRRRTQQHVPFLKEGFPGTLQHVSGVVEIEPFGMRKSLFRNGAAVVGCRKISPEMTHSLPKSLVLHARGQTRQQQPIENSKSGLTVDRRFRAVV